jgi:hypothetical protein
MACLSIAERLLTVRSADGSIAEALLTLAAPIQAIPGEWHCAIGLSCGSLGKTFTIVGEDSLQALNLAMGFIPSAILTLARMTGGAVTWNDGVPPFQLGRL